MSAVGAEPAVIGAEDLVAISTDVWECFLGEEVWPLTTEHTDASPTVLATVGVTGAWGGHVLIELTADGAERAARAMLGLDRVTSADVTDAVGELANMVGGNVKSLLPAPSHLGLPMVVTGTLAPTPGSDTVEMSRADLAWADTSLRVSVWAKTWRTAPGEDR